MIWTWEVGTEARWGQWIVRWQWDVFWEEEEAEEHTKTGEDDQEEETPDELQKKKKKKKESSKVHWWGGGGRGEDDDEEQEEEDEEHWCTLYFPNSRLVCSDRLITYNERSPSWANAETKAGA